MDIQWDIQTHETLPSTQDMCKELAASGAQEGLVIQALEQTNGRGRRGRSWDSGEDNLSISLLLRPDCPAQNVGQLSILIGVALCEAAKQTGANDLILKWPNDLLVDGRKCAGILLDSSLSGANIEWVVVGIGVNTASAPPEGGVLEVAREAFLDGMLEQVTILYAQWRALGFAGIRSRWLENSYRKGTPLNVGAFNDLDALGNLVVLDDTNALKTISAGDVYLKDADYVAGH